MPPSARRHRWSPARVRIGKMQKTKHKGRGKNIACLNKKQNASKAVLKQCISSEDGYSNLVKSCENSSGELTKQIVSKLSKSVVSIASFRGDTVISECTGIFIENLCADSTTILTSSKLVGSLLYGFTDKLTFKVRLPNDLVVIGSLVHIDIKHDLAIVKIRRARGVQEAHLSSQFESNNKVVAVGRCFDSGKLRFTNGTVIGHASCEIPELLLSTDEMNTALNGCPIIDFDGNFVGANFPRGKSTAFVPMSKILEFLEYTGTIRHSAADTTDKRDSNRHSTADANDKHGLNSCSMLYESQDATVDQDLDLSRQDQIVFVYREEFLSGFIYS